MMRLDPDKPGLLRLLAGEGEPFMRFLAWAFVGAIVVLAVVLL
jgi:hypothetical protein